MNSLQEVSQKHVVYNKCSNKRKGKVNNESSNKAPKLAGNTPISIGPSTALTNVSSIATSAHKNNIFDSLNDDLNEDNLTGVQNPVSFGYSSQNVNPISKAESSEWLPVGPKRNIHIAKVQSHKNAQETNYSLNPVNVPKNLKDFMGSKAEEISKLFDIDIIADEYYGLGKNTPLRRWKSKLGHAMKLFRLHEAQKGPWLSELNLHRLSWEFTEEVLPTQIEFIQKNKNDFEYNEVEIEGEYYLEYFIITGKGTIVAQIEALS